MKAYSLVLAVGASITVLGGLAPGAVTSPKLDSGEKSIRKVCVLPVEAEMNKSGMKGGEGMTKEADEWGPKVGDVVTKVIGATGAEVIPGALSEEQLRANDSLRQTLLQLNQKYDSVAAQLHKNPKDLKKGRYTLGDEVALLPCAAQADSLAFVHAKATVLTGGKKAFGALVGGASKSRSDVWVTFVDAKSGEALAYTRVLTLGDRFRQDPAKAYTNALTKEFKKMRVGAQGGKKKK